MGLHPPPAFTDSLLNERLLKMAICSPPREVALRRYSEIYITELGDKARRAARAPEREAVAS